MNSYDKFIELLGDIDYIEDTNSGQIWDSGYLIDDINEKSIEDEFEYILNENGEIGCRKRKSGNTWNWDSGWKVSSELDFNKGEKP